MLGQVASFVEKLVALDALVKSFLGYVVGAGIGAGNLMLLRNDTVGLFFISRGVSISLNDIWIDFLFFWSLWYVVVGFDRAILLV